MQNDCTSQTCKACGEAKPLEGFDRYPNGKHRAKCRACVYAAHNARASANTVSGRLEREEREAALRDDLLSAMYRGRSLRALEAVKDRPEGMHTIRLTDGGYITIAEHSCRCVERDACSRAAKACKTHEAAIAAVRILERPTPAVARMREVKDLWRTYAPPLSIEALLGIEDDEDADEEADLLNEAFGDWAPSWMQNTHHASLAA